MKIEFSNLSKKFLKKCQKEDAGRIINKIEGLVKKPFPSESIKLHSKDNLFRIRVGKYRIIYKVKYKEKILLITEIGKRGKIYK